MLTNLVVTKLFLYLCTMKKDILKIIIKVALYALGLIAAYFGVSTMTSCSTSHNVVASGRTSIVTVDTKLNNILNTVNFNDETAMRNFIHKANNF